MWSSSSQTRNELKRKAKLVVEKLYLQGGQSIGQRAAIAVWLLETHPTSISDGEGPEKICNVPNFIFGGLQLAFDKMNNVDAKVCLSSICVQLLNHTVSCSVASLTRLSRSGVTPFRS